MVRMRAGRRPLAGATVEIAESDGRRGATSAVRSPMPAGRYVFALVPRATIWLVPPRAGYDASAVVNLGYSRRREPSISS